MAERAVSNKRKLTRGIGTEKGRSGYFDESTGTTTTTQKITLGISLLILHARIALRKEGVGQSDVAGQDVRNQRNE